MQAKTIEEINNKIRKGNAVVMTATEIKQLAESSSPEDIFEHVDIVTTATFGAMCSSGAFINFGHGDPPIRMEKTSLNDVPVFSGIAAVDAYIGATEVSPNNEQYGGAHVIEALIKGENIKLKASAKGTDCYPRKEISTTINKNSVNEVFLFNPRNAYQNYCAATNSSKQVKYTYMGCLLPNHGNITYATSGELSPLINDPYLRTIGIGTRIFIGGAKGYVAWNGTQFNTSKPRNSLGVPQSNAATLSVIGNLKDMDQRFIKAAYIEKYGVSLFVGIGIPIPVLDIEMVKRLFIRNHQIETTLIDYGHPDKPALKVIDYAELQSGSVILNGKSIRSAPLSSISKSIEICNILKSQILHGQFELSAPLEAFPQNTSLNKLPTL